MSIMVSELLSRQIVALSRDGASAEEIATSAGISIELVKLVLARHNQIGDADITEEDLANLRAHALGLALNADDLSIQAKMTQWLIERARPTKSEQTVSPIMLVNQALIAMNGEYKAMLEKS